MTDALTATERKVYHYLLDFLSEHTYQPSVREIGRTFQIKSTKTVSELLQSIADKGYIERDPSRSRGVRLLGFAGTRETVPVPYYSRLPAGSATLTAAHRDRYLTIDRRFVPADSVFFVRAAHGGAPAHGVLEGDYIMVDPGANACAGDLVAERHEEAVGVRPLSAAEAASTTSTVNGHYGAAMGGAVPLLGVVCGVFRPFREIAAPAPPTAD